MIFAQNNKPLPEPSKGQRVIIDERTQEVKPDQAPPIIPQSLYYWLGAVVLIVVAVVASISIMVNNKKQRRNQGQ